jgi:uncharacterized protein (DUF1499 family)
MPKVILPLVLAVGFLSLLLLYLAGVGYQSGSLQLGQSFALMRYCAMAGIAGTGLSVFYILWQRPLGMRLGVIFLAALSGLGAFYLPYRQQLMAQMVPPIHDITTDTVNPPLFVAVLPLRASAPNPADYAGEDIARLQREAYPDIRPVELTHTPDEVFAAALRVVAASGWELVDADTASGRIEAVATTRWFGFKDDVVLRIQPGRAGMSVVDMRSKSRVGRSDIGANAARIRGFFAALQQQLQQG